MDNLPLLAATSSALEALSFFAGIYAIPVLLLLLMFIAAIFLKARRYDELIKEIGSLKAFEERSLSQIKQLNAGLEQRHEKLNQREQALVTMAREKTAGFPWFANAYADFLHLQDLQVAEEMVNKSRPAYSSAEKVKEAAKRRREAEKIAKIFKYQIEYYESLFPWLADLKGEEIEDELIRIQDTLSDDNGEDPAARWLTPEEYKSLPNSEKYQKALDRYWTKKKGKWEIGRDYERFIGYKYESEGADVAYHGIIEGFDDLGRDLIVTSGSEVRIVQCKYWSSEKTIHEKHIFQLHGTTIAYTLDHPKKKVRGHFVTSTKLSDRARQFADHLAIEVSEGLPLSPYPCIKCNIAGRNKERIYHLPFDQQYDTTRIEKARGELYVATVAEAEELGFRRAFRYRGALA